MTEHNDLQHKLVNDVYAELGTISKHSQDVIDYLMRHGWIRTPAETEAAARGGKVERSAKYADLIHEIEESDSMTGCERATVEALLDWFDRNLDQTPRLTITDSQLKTMAGQLFYRWSDLATMADKLADELNEVGVTVTPVPEPTLLPNTPGATVKMRKHHQWVRTTTGAWISTDGSVLDQDGAQEIADEHGFAIIHDGVTSDHDRAWWIENANVNDAEDCEACVGDLCPVHHGMAVGIELMARKIAALGADPEMFALIPDPPKAKEGAQK